MSDQDGSQKFDDIGQDDNNEDGQNLFNDIVVGNQDNQEQKKVKKLRKAKKEKKSKKEKKDKKKKRRHEQEQDDYGYDEDEQDQRNSFFDDQAESDDDQQNYSNGDKSAEIGQEQEHDRFNEMMQKRSTREDYYKRFEGQNDRDINARYSRGATMLRENQAMYPVEHQPKIYIVNVKPRHEDQLVLYILNKAKHLAQTTNKVTIITATAIRKKFTSRIFIQAFSQKDVRDSLEGFTNINLGKTLNQLDRQGYVQLFNDKIESKTQFQQLNYVRVNKGLYQGDLAQILKIRNNSIDVIIVPRLNVQQISMRIRQQTAKIADEIQRKKKMSQLLQIFLQYKSNNFRKKPNKQPLTDQQLRQELGDIASIKKIKLVANPAGLIILNYKFDQLQKIKGIIRPVQMMPFTSSQGNFIGKMTQQKANFTTQTQYKKGQQIQIISGGLRGYTGVIYQVRDNVAIIICKDKTIKDQKIQQPVQNIVKRFRKGQRVKVNSGDDIGKVGTVIKIHEKQVDILTDNNNSIRINKRNLQVSIGQPICQQNVHKLNKNDLIKTTKNQIGIVLQTTKDNIKILDTNNTLQVVSNMDFDSKLNTKNIVAKNRTGDQINAGCLIIIRQGLHQGKKCKVIHVYRQNVFLFNAQFNRTGGITVQSAQNCALMSKNQQPQQSRSFSAKSANLGTTDAKDQITVGKTITLRTGPLKGYQGVVKSINKDNIEVRVLSKACTQWVPRQNISAKQETMEIGKTPNRKAGNTHNYVAPSPSRY